MSPQCGPPGRCWRYICHHAIMVLSGLGTSHTDAEITPQHIPTKIPWASSRSSLGSAALVWAVPLEKRHEGVNASYARPGFPLPRRTCTSLLCPLGHLLQGVTASETARAGEATSEITELRPSEGTWLAHGNPGTGISSPAQNPLPHLSLPPVTLLDTLPPPPPAGPRHLCADRCALPVAWASPPPGPFTLAPIPLTASGVPFRAGNLTGGRETWLCLIRHTLSPGGVRTSKLDPALQNIP